MFPASKSIESMTGLKPMAKKSSKVRRGRGKSAKSGKPGASHHTAMNQAYAAGDFAKAKSHALNFANAMHAHLGSSVPPAAAPMAAEADGSGYSITSGDAAPSMGTAGMTSDPAAKRAKLAAALKARKQTSR